MLRRHLIVSGRVQGVFFRASTQKTAQSLGLTGWVQNLPDGRVEIMAEGAEGELARLESWCHDGPLLARVSSVEVITAEAATGEFGSFSVKR